MTRISVLRGGTTKFLAPDDYSNLKDAKTPACAPSQKLVARFSRSGRPQLRV